ncbi:MAG: arylesterase [Candidatus Omnitrophica bacterium]|nr:arylesterase [Candidatus Omnitrophota bacterium]
MNNARHAIILLLLVLLGCSPRVANLDSTGKTIVCFGDSITAGFGAESGADYPSLLSRMGSWPVINAGVAGDTTADALKRIEEDVLVHEPRMVIILLGGNDFFRKVPQAETSANMEGIVAQVQGHGAIAVVAAVKIGLLQDIYTKEFKRIAREKGALFVPNIMKGILTDPKLKYDQIHPNAAGYRLIAERVYKAIEPLL